MGFRWTSPTCYIAICHRCNLTNNHHSAHRHIVVKVQSTLQFEGRGVPHFDLKSGAVEIKVLAIARYAEREARAARELGGSRAPVRRQVKGPEFTAAIPVLSVADHAITSLAVGRHLY